VSIIAGLVRFDGAPIDRATIDRMAARIGERAPDGVSIHCAGPAGFIRGSLDVTPESSAQPLIDRHTGRIVLFDGRLDNRGDLIGQLELASSASDVELVAAAHGKWGRDAAVRLLGDFALSVWDPVERSLTCARDVAGICPLYYRVGDGWLAWSSAIDLLAGAISPPPGLNEGMLAEILSAYLVSCTETTYAGVFRLQAGHALHARDGRVALHRYWTPEPRELRYATDAEYEEHLLDLLKQAVGARLRTRGGIGIMLSGGVDSSSLAALAGNQHSDRVETFSISAPGPDDERPFFERVNAHLGLTGHTVAGVQPVPGVYRAEAAREMQPATFANGPTLDAVYSTARDAGIRVLLDGLGADDWLGASTWACADLFRGFRWLALAERIRRDELFQRPGGVKQAIHGTLWPLLPTAVRKGLRLALRRGEPPPWIEHTFASRVQLRDRMAIQTPDIGFASYESEDTWRCCTGGGLADSLEVTARGGARAGIELWHPYLDRRIIEFGLSLPGDQRWRGGRPKDLLRRTMARTLPDSVVSRTWNPGADFRMAEAIESEGGMAAIDGNACARRGWVRVEVVRKMYEDMIELRRAGRPEFGKPAMIVWSVVAVGRWLDLLDVVK